MGGTTQENLLYLSVTRGRMVNKKAGVISHDFNAYKGIFLGIREKQAEFENKPVLKIELKLKDSDSDEIVIIQMTKKAWGAYGLLSTIEKINLAKPFTVKVWGSEDNEKMSFLGLQQDGYKYQGQRKTIEKDESYPKPKPVTISGEKQWDWTDVFVKMDATIKSITEKMVGQTSAAPAQGAEDTGFALHAPAGDDDLPF